MIKLSQSVSIRGCYSRDRLPRNMLPLALFYHQQARKDLRAQRTVLLSGLLNLVLLHLPQNTRIGDAPGDDRTNDLLAKTQSTHFSFPVGDICFHNVSNAIKKLQVSRPAAAYTWTESQ